MVTKADHFSKNSRLNAIKVSSTARLFLNIVKQNIMKLLSTLALFFAVGAMAETATQTISTEPDDAIESVVATILTEEEFFEGMPAAAVDEARLETRAKKFKKYVDIPGLGRYMFKCEDNDGPCDAIVMYYYKAPASYSSWVPSDKY